MKKKQIYALGITLATGLSLLTACKGNNQQAGAEQAPPELAVMTISEDVATMEAGYPTTLKGENDVEIRPQITGFLTKVCVQEGQHVSRGQVLFMIDKDQLQAAVDAAQASINVAQANVNTAKTNVNNNKILLDKNIISASAYQTSVDQYNAALASLSQAQANLKSARKNLSYSSVTAPTSGVVGTIDYKEGSLVSPQSLLTILSNNGEMEANFSLNEKDILALTDNGQRSLSTALQSMPEVTLQLANGERYQYKGKIRSVSGVIDPNTGAASVKAYFPNPNGMLQSGNTGQVMIPSMHNNAILIPQNATYELQDMKFVYVMNDSSIVHSRPITVDKQDDGKHYIVTSGLKPGEKIVIEGVGINVQEGMTIKPKMGR
ncbi:MAG: efflux RND transporter periplasmic adaptor subunit [Clostridium sp.]|nr:efflux RND transporter periplasmic adaptor subunit [Prevotella sp.]MCM1429329.1 efflux RND transporter periplasmic adaptor subunit [Clostridium sp.]MCM1475637.1 efflux RND transporter periplasmic adaptor subunit [Muribaculaceae bacterium]